VYFEHGTFDVLPLLGTRPKRLEWWSEHYTKCKNSPGRRMLITTSKVRSRLFIPSTPIPLTPPLFLQAAQSDFEAVLEADGTHPTESPKQLASFAEHGPSTLYGQEFLVTVVDEAHLCRNMKKAFFTFFGLMERSQCRIAMTATPIISRPQVSVIAFSLPFSILILLQDVWNLGRLLRIDAFSSATADEEYREMDLKIRRSMAKDRKQLRKSGEMEALIEATVKGQAEPERVSAYEREMRRMIDTTRVRYAGLTIRRTLRSIDYAGKRISGLKPFSEHFIKVLPYPHEITNLESVAQELIRDGTHKVAQVAGGSVSPAASFVVLHF